jgi:hypothetical protein
MPSAQGYLTKPLKISNLVDEVAKLIAEARSPSPSRFTYRSTHSSCSKRFQLHLPGHRYIRFQFSDVAEKHLRMSSKQESFGTKNLKSDGHLITEDSVLPTTAPGGAPERNRCYQDARYFIISPPCARFVRALGAPRTAHFATPPLGAGAFVVIAVMDFFWLGLKGKESR